VKPKYVFAYGSRVYYTL